MKRTSNGLASVMIVAALLCGLWAGCKQDAAPPLKTDNVDTGNVGAGNAPDFNFGATGNILLRASDFQVLDGKMQLVATGGDGVELAPAEQYVFVADESIPKESDPKVHFVAWQTDVPADGTYNVWVYAWWFDTCANSVYLNIDNGGTAVLPDQKMGDDGVVKKWHWVPLGVPLKLKAGASKIVLKCREDGARVGAVLLTTKSSIPQSPEG